MRILFVLSILFLSASAAAFGRDEVAHFSDTREERATPESRAFRKRIYLGALMAAQNHGGAPVATDEYGNLRVAGDGTDGPGYFDGDLLVSLTNGKQCRVKNVVQSNGGPSDLRKRFLVSCKEEGAPQE